MKLRKRTYQEASAVDFLVMRDRLGLQRYRKTTPRDPEKRRILLSLALLKIKEKEQDDFIPVGYRKRKLRI